MVKHVTPLREQIKAAGIQHKYIAELLRISHTQVWRTLHKYESAINRQMEYAVRGALAEIQADIAAGKRTPRGKPITSPTSNDNING